MLGTASATPTPLAHTACDGTESSATELAERCRVSQWSQKIARTHTHTHICTRASVRVLWMLCCEGLSLVSRSTSTCSENADMVRGGGAHKMIYTLHGQSSTNDEYEDHHHLHEEDEDQAGATEHPTYHAETQQQQRREQQATTTIGRALSLSLSRSSLLHRPSRARTPRSLPHCHGHKVVCLGSTGPHL